MLSSGAVAADSNGFFHPLGDHAQTSFSIDGQPISDQQSKAFSTQIPLDAIQSMELITGAPPAEFGDKTSLIVNAVTQVGPGPEAKRQLHGAVGFVRHLLGGGDAGVRRREGRETFSPSTRCGPAGSWTRRSSRRFTPSATTARSSTASTTARPGRDAFHLNLFGARNWFQIPNTYDQPGQDQRQKASTFNFAPGYQHTFGANTLLTVNPFYRRDRVNYYPSRDPFNDTPATIAQNRTLTNWGVKADMSYVERPAQPEDRHAAHADAPAREFLPSASPTPSTMPFAWTTTATRRNCPRSPIRTTAPRPASCPIRICSRDCFPTT